MKLLSILAIAALVSPWASAQGTLVYDQQTTTGDIDPGYGAGTAISLIGPPWGQSFTPSLDTVGFIALPLDDPSSGFGGATVWVNLMSGSVSGPVMASTEPITLGGGFNGTFYFNFATPVSVTPGVQYYFTVKEAFGGTRVNVVDIESSYPGGSIYVGGAPSLGFDFLFREGTIVSSPEPSSGVLLLLGGCALAFLRRVKRSQKKRVDLYCRPES